MQSLELSFSIENISRILYTTFIVLIFAKRSVVVDFHIWIIKMQKTLIIYIYIFFFKVAFVFVVCFRCWSTTDQIIELLSFYCSLVFTTFGRNKIIIISILHKILYCLAQRWWKWQCKSFKFLQGLWLVATSWKWAIHWFK